MTSVAQFDSVRTTVVAASSSMAGVSRLGWMGRSSEARPDGSCLVELAFTAQTADQIILSGQCRRAVYAAAAGMLISSASQPTLAGPGLSAARLDFHASDTKLGHELRELPWSDIERHQPGNFTTCPMTSLARRSSGVGTRELWSACESSSWRSAGAQPYVGSISRKRRPFGREKTVTAVDASANTRDLARHSPPGDRPGRTPTDCLDRAESCHREPRCARRHPGRDRRGGQCQCERTYLGAGGPRPQPALRGQRRQSRHRLRRENQHKRPAPCGRHRSDRRARLADVHLKEDQGSRDPRARRRNDRLLQCSNPC